MATAAQTLARAILATAKAHENSYDKVAAQEAINSSGKMINYANFYQLTLKQAAEQNSPKSLDYPVYLALKYTWNDSLQWAEENK